MKPITLALLLGLGVSSLPHAEASGQDAADSGRAESEALRVFMDCRSRYCDFDYMRREIDFINYVRDRQDAQVHVLVTTQRTGSGGTEFSIAYIGREDFETVDDSLTYFSGETDTFDEVREGLTHMIKLGLIRYVARLPEGGRIDVTYQAADSLEPTPQVIGDPWNFWIFRVRVGGDISGEQRQKFFATNGSLSANRTTEEWKIRLFVNGWYSEDKFEFSDGSKLTSISRNYGGGGFVAKSAGEHWSLGVTAEARVSTFRNQDFALEAGPAVEYNIFPYSESSRREFTFVFAALVNYFDYELVTFFDKTSESRPASFVNISYSVRQPFGNINASLEGFTFLDNFSQHRLELSARLNIRLVRGLQLNINSRILRTKDQIYLPREGATDEEVLLRLRELGTDYRYFLNVSLSYTFGSIFNNIVNPRFD